MPHTAETRRLPYLALGRRPNQVVKAYIWAPNTCAQRRDTSEWEGDVVRGAISIGILACRLPLIIFVFLFFQGES